MANDYLRINKLSAGYNSKAVIEDVDFGVKKGEIIALIGPNGAGKSTILKTISRQLDIIKGSIFLDGKSITDYSYREMSKKMAVILTDRINVELTSCRDIVSTGRYPYTGRMGILAKKDEEKVEEALHTVQCSEIADRDFNNISDGQKQRILLARAICQEPEIIVLDEPTSYLDIKHKIELLNILTAMAREKDITVISSLHEIDLAQKVADRIVAIKGKEYYKVGTAEEIFKEDKIKELYDIDNGFYDPIFGSIELKKPTGRKAEVFVLAGGGSGISVYRRLQKSNTAFSTGILAENDIDYRLARFFACEVISERPFTDIKEETFLRAKAAIEKCGSVIIADENEEEMTCVNKELLEYARGIGKRILRSGLEDSIWQK